jgi:hypothetical protein
MQRVKLKYVTKYNIFRRLFLYVLSNKHFVDISLSLAGKSFGKMNFSVTFLLTAMLTVQKIRGKIIFTQMCNFEELGFFLFYVPFCLCVYLGSLTSFVYLYVES